MSFASSRFITEIVWRRLWGSLEQNVMASNKVQTQTATVHSIDTDTYAGQDNNQAVTRRDLDMLAQNLTTTFIEQLRAIVNANAATPYQ